MRLLRGERGAARSRMCARTTRPQAQPLTGNGDLSVPKGVRTSFRNAIGQRSVGGKGGEAEGGARSAKKLDKEGRREGGRERAKRQNAQHKREHHDLNHRRTPDVGLSVRIC